MKIRKALDEELAIIYLMGFDVWADGGSEADYLKKCRESKKYKAGIWYVLANESGVVSSLIVYTSIFGVPENYCGIGSVATNPQQRNKGYSSHLITGVCASLKDSGCSGVYLHSDIDISFYERLGFIQASSESSKCLVRTFDKLKIIPNEIPTYF
jgi:predicted N-acetyltransferase YhbS